ncbi:MAG TPA: large conductance mechanosensitive channel protein MscL [Candidatus Binatia bacterium]|nr:large conductance mechanosensitive channel protein MscL [Candidatus Binatia bacterium]
MNPTPLAKIGRGGFREFKEFALKGSVLDMAIGIILGVAFGKIITSFVDDIIMPLFGRIFGKVDFSNMFVSLTGRHFDTVAAAKSVGAPTLNYGLFMNAILNFIIVAFGVFLLVRQVNRLHRTQEVEMKQCPFCFSGIVKKASRCPFCTSSLEEGSLTAAH